jgi:peptide/nickel transport system permease protein
MAVQEIKLKATVPSSPLTGFWNVFKKNRLAIVGLFMLVVSSSSLRSSRMRLPHTTQDLTQAFNPATSMYPPARPLCSARTTPARMCFSSFMYGARNSLIVGFFASFISMFIGGTFGIVPASTAAGREFDYALHRHYAGHPRSAVIVVFVALTKPSLWNIILVIGLLGWTTDRAHRPFADIGGQVSASSCCGRAPSAQGTFIIIRRTSCRWSCPSWWSPSCCDLAGHPERIDTGIYGPGRPARRSWGQMLNFAFNRGAMSVGAWWAMVVPGFGIVWVVLA